MSWALIAFESADAVTAALEAFKTDEGRAALGHGLRKLVVRRVDAEQAAKSKGAMHKIEDTVQLHAPFCPSRSSEHGSTLLNSKKSGGWPTRCPGPGSL